MLIQLNPAIPVVTPLGDAVALFLQGDDWDVYWGCAQKKTGEMWWWQNQYIRLANNITGGHVSATPIKVPPELEEKLKPHLERHR